MSVFLVRYLTEKVNLNKVREKELLYLSANAKREYITATDEKEAIRKFKLKHGPSTTILHFMTHEQTLDTIKQCELKIGSPNAPIYIVICDELNSSESISEWYSGVELNGHYFLPVISFEYLKAISKARLLNPNIRYLGAIALNELRYDANLMGQIKYS